VPHDEIAVVAPYNAQVNLLRELLPADVRVGTVDKFQGQEARVVLYSMASSSGEDIPRGLEFLLSRNRLNVAISRARCLAYLVCSPRLLDVNCRTIDQMRLAREPTRRRSAQGATDRVFAVFGSADGSDRRGASVGWAPSVSALSSAGCDLLLPYRALLSDGQEVTR
jgi:hypothetical protein